MKQELVVGPLKVAQQEWFALCHVALRADGHLPAAGGVGGAAGRDNVPPAAQNLPLSGLSVTC
jgi:hypothetical protein